jgi:hypothetical protein
VAAALTQVKDHRPQNHPHPAQMSSSLRIAN